MSNRRAFGLLALLCFAMIAIAEEKIVVKGTDNTDVVTVWLDAHDNVWSKVGN